MLILRLHSVSSSFQNGHTGRKSSSGHLCQLWRTRGQSKKQKTFNEIDLEQQPLRRGQTPTLLYAFTKRFGHKSKNTRTGQHFKDIECADSGLAKMNKWRFDSTRELLQYPKAPRAWQRSYKNWKSKLPPSGAKLHLSSPKQLQSHLFVKQGLPGHQKNAQKGQRSTLWTYFLQNWALDTNCHVDPMNIARCLKLKST